MTRRFTSTVPRRAAAVLLAAVLATTAAPAVADDVATEPTAQAAPSAEPQAEETPAEEAPAQEAPVDEAPAEEAPVDEAPAEEAPTAGAPVDVSELAADSPNVLDTALENVSLLAFVPGEPSTLTVNSAGVAADANIGDGVCDTGAVVGADPEADPPVEGAPECTLRAALQEANAVDLESGDAPSSITIDFTDLGLLSYGAGAVNSSLMSTDNIGNYAGSVGLGASFVVESAVPVAIDFDNLAGIEHAADSPYALFEVRSNNVALRNAATMRAGEGAIAISGTGVTVDNVVISDNETANLEVGIALLDGASDVTVSDSSIESAFFVGVLVDIAANVTNVTLDNVTSRGHGSAHIDFEDASVVNGFVVQNSQIGASGEAAPSPHVFINPRVDVTGLELRDSRFESPNQIGLGVYGGGVTLTDTVLDGAVFNGTGIAFQDGGAAIVNGLDIVDSTFAGVLNRAINLEATRASDVEISGNLFTDMRANAAATIYVGYVSDESVIGDNRFIQGEGEGIDRNRWAVFFAPRDAAAGVDTGWSIVDNQIDGYQGATDGPIRMNATGDTFVARNEFGPNTVGTTLTESENGTRFFVYNNGSANGPIQTWRPTASAVGGGELRVRVAPVNPPLPRNGAPTGPVDLDVYWTATDNAEVYVGTIEDVTGPVTRSFDFDGEAGFVRVQTHDADGRSSQYSASVQQVEDDEAPAPVVVDDAPADGTGEPGATVVIRDEDGNVVATGEVDDDGNFVIDLDEPLDCDVEYTATQVDVAGNESEPTVFTPSACDDGGIGDGGDGDNGDGDGDNAAGGADDDGSALPDAGGPAGITLMLAAALAALAGGTALVRRRREA